MTSHLPFSAVILAGGQSRRMGRDKAWLEIDGQPLIQRQVCLARETGAAEVFISGRAEADYTSVDWRVLRDKFKNAGPLAGIEPALAAAANPLLLVIAVDLPHMSAAVLERLLSCCTATCGAIPRLGGQIEPLAAFYPASTHDIAVAQLSAGRNAVHEFAARCVTGDLARFVDLSADDAAPFQNWNQPTDVK